MNYDIFIPIRLSSTRLPKKHLKIIKDKPIILHLIKRLTNAKKIRNIVICTTDQKVDDPLVEILKGLNVKIFRGSEKDILNRYLEAAKKFETDFIINADGDDIYADPDYVDEIVSIFERDNCDYVDMIGFPFGMASVGIKFTALEKVCKYKQTEDTSTGYRLFFTKNKIFNVSQLKLEKGIIFPKNLRLTLDYEEDLLLAKEIYNELGTNFRLSHILELFSKKPELLEITNELDLKYKKHWDKNLTDVSIKNIY